MQIDPTLQNLPPSFDRSTESNNWKLMQLAEQPMSKGEDQLNFMFKMRALDTSKKEFLDRIGKLIGIYRGQADDDFYRRMIYARLARRHTDGTINQIYDVVSAILSADPHEFRVRSLWNVTGEPMAIEVLNVPAIYIDSQEKEALLLDQIRSSVAAPTRVAGIGFQKTVNSTLYYAMQFQTTQVIESTMSVPQLKEG
ncbi:hypothetical protein [Levilactobacillus namurensis]|uniref:hypothetical protein n=1 Tax=Levilactobacillus namurensis TaxID=380393 RepID=UPI00222E1938|nr:hypothetical protein [Levilactobacillus namurensis]MCW3777947.1 hypothetical protein [Levilactobacillus namurensis]MDT7018295.1 hypothetical protein [Levilactobacillus namurensis]WNN64718.1 hypothetical protein RIN67_08330 [Levilactobacillus namurensis]